MFDKEVADRIFFHALVFMLFVGRVFMGCELDLKIVKNSLKRPIAPTIGFCTQFIIMPLLAYTFARTLLVDQKTYMILGLFVMGCVPGGDASNFYTYMLGANVNLSVTMTFVSTIASLVMTSFWIKFLGYELSKGKNKKEIVMGVPYINLIISLFALTIPLLVGIAIAKYRPVWAEKTRKAFRPFIFIFVIFMVIFGTILYYPIFIQQINSKVLIAAFLLPFCGFYCGFFLAFLLRQKIEDVIAIGIETGVQNMPIAIAVLKISFPGWRTDEWILLPTIVGVLTPIPILTYYAIQKIMKRLKGECPIENGVIKPSKITVIQSDLLNNEKESDKFLTKTTES